mmetsp:Transcript_37989/g.74400  ORF Transcript_37989/g.74400 Transcript_37989/m.74400 type:complete len:89 (+) Transcript_37989:356-622(+)
MGCVMYGKFNVLAGTLEGDPDGDFGTLEGGLPFPLSMAVIDGQVLKRPCRCVGPVTVRSPSNFASAACSLYRNRWFSASRESTKPVIG